MSNDKVLEVGTDLVLLTNKPHLVTPKEVLKKGKRLGQEESIQRKVKLDWDGKRVLINPTINVFRDCSTTKPLIEAPTPQTGRPRKSGRPRQVDENTRQRVLELSRQGPSIRKIANELGLSVGSVYKAIRESTSQSA